MSGSVLLDANILVLLAVGTASPAYIAVHKNTADSFDEDDFDLVAAIISGFSEILVVPHVVAEASNLVRQIGNPRKAAIQQALAEFASLLLEVPVASTEGFAREEHLDLGVTDAVLLHLCGSGHAGEAPTLLTIDGPLANRAASLGYGVIDFAREFQGR